MNQIYIPLAQKLTHIHDKFIKELLSDKEVAIDFLNEYLSDELLSLIKIETIEQETTSYINTNLEESFCDIVWRVETQDSSLKICLLLEHKSYKDPHVAFQILEYIALAYQHQIKAKKPIELVVPILYYHGKTKLKLRTLHSFFEQYATTFQKYLPSYDLELIDLASLNAAQLLNLRNGMLSSALMIQRHYFDSEKLNANIRNIVKSLEPYLEKNLSNIIFVYLIQFLELTETELIQKLEEIPKDINNKIMSLYDQLLERGRKEGIEKGRVEGIEKTILNAFDNKIPLETIRIITGESLEKIENVLLGNGRK